jgi:S1-C subfamily serine protease
MKKNRKFQALLIVFLVIIALCFSGSLAKTMAASSQDIVGSSIVADIAEASSPKVVWIETTYENKQQMVFSPFGDFGQEPIPSKGLGSGFFFNEKGYILTNYHVVNGAKSISVKLKDQKDSFPATFIGGDPVLDVAIIKIDSDKKTPFIKFGDSDKARVGEWVIAIGNPHNLDHTVTLGIISAKGRPITANTNNLYEDMIQTDAAINPGNSGGPLLNIKGEVIGINTLVASGQGLGFAIPINTVQENLNELMTKGKLSHPWLGVSLKDVRDLDQDTRDYLNIGKDEGVLISPARNSPAAKAGLRQYDVVLEINHQAISSSEQLIKLIRKMKVGDKVTVLISRNGNLMTKEVVLEERPTS